MLNNWGKRLDEAVARLGLETPVSLPTIKPTKQPNHLALWYPKTSPGWYFWAMGGTVVLAFALAVAGTR